METKRPTVPEAEAILNNYYPVLDHGFVSLVDYMGSDQCIETAARVSYKRGNRVVSKTRDLLRYLYRHQHSTPTGMVELKFHCCMPIFVARQWVRHRTASLNEVSGRYSMLPSNFYTPTPEQFREQNKSNKQGRGEVMNQQYNTARESWQKGRACTTELYEWLSANDVARELARIDLPLSTYTQWFWKIDLKNLLHFLSLRTDGHAQWEIRQYAEPMAAIVRAVAPLAYEAWIDYDVCGVRFSRAELGILLQYVSVMRDTIGANADDAVVEETSRSECTKYGMNGREFDEMLAKFTPRTVPDFRLPEPIGTDDPRIQAWESPGDA